MQNEELDIAPQEVSTPAPRQPRKGKWRRRILTFLAWLIGVPLFLIIALQFSYPQTFVAGYALDWLSKELDFEVKARKIHLNLITSTLTLENVQILDRQGKTMIAVEQLFVDFDFNTVLKNGDIYLKDVLLKRGAINLIIDEKTKALNIEEFIERIEKLTAPKEPKKNSPPTVFQIRKAKLEDVFFSYHDNELAYKKGKGMDYAHFGLEHMDGELRDLRIAADTIDVRIKGLKAIEQKTALPIHNLTTHFFMTNRGMAFQELNLALGESVLRKEVKMSYDSPKDLGSFVQKVNITADFDSTILATKDLQIFAPDLEKYKDTWRITGILKGRVSDFAMDDLQLGWGKGSTWRGYAAMKGLPAIDSTYMNLDFREAKLISRDLLQYVNQEEANQILERLGEVAIFKGLYKGYVSDFEAGGSFQTALGEFDTQMRLALGDGRQAPYYKAKVSTPDLQIGKLLGIDDLKNVAVDGEVEGTGFTPETAKLKLDTKVKFADFNNYRYQNIEIKGDISHQRFEGDCYSKDANFDFDLNGTVDFNTRKSEANYPPGRFNLKADIRKIDLQALHFLPEKTTLKGKMEMDMRGLHIDSLSGWASFKDIDLYYKGKDLHTDHFDLLSEKRPNGERQFIINSDYAILDTEGKFFFSDVMQDLPTLAYEYYLSLENRKSSLEAYYKKKKKEKDKNYKLRFDLILSDINPIVAFFDEKLHVGKGAIIHGEYAQQRTARFNLYTEKPIDSVFYGANKLYDIAVDLNSSKHTHDSEVLAALQLESSRQVLGGMDFDSTFIEAAWGKEGIDFDTKIHQSNSSNRAKLMGKMQLQDDTTLLNFTKTDLQFYNDHWVFDKNNEININPYAVVFNNVLLRNQRSITSQIGVQGMISDSLPTPLAIDLKQIDLGSFAQVFKVDLNGSLNGNFTLANLTKKPDIKGEMNIENLMYKEMLIGDVDGVVKWIDKEEKLDIDLTGFRKNRYILSLMGGYYPNNPKNALDFEVKFNRTDLEIFEPFADEFVSKVGGNLQGKVFIKGKVSEPDVHGKVRINNGRFKFNLLGTHYDAEGDIIIRKDEILANKIDLYDERTNPATINFKLFHDNFKDFYVDVDSRFYHEFQVMNTEATPNCMYYGTAYASGDAKIRGMLDNLTMVVNAKSRKGTKIFLPLDGYQEVGAKDYIRFVTKDKKDSVAVRKINLGGMTLKFNLDVTPNADFDIIIDSRTGDMITAKGKGNIDMEINQVGDMSIKGRYIIQQGKYNFTFANLVNKAFEITPNSSIQFNGDVFQSQLDVRAVYEKSIPFTPLIDFTKLLEREKNNPELKRPYSVKAILDMKGGLFSPEIKLGLDLSSADRITNTNLQTAVMQLKAQIANDEQERNRQVFSVLMLNQLSQPNAFTVTGTGTMSSISEMIANQFSSWISQVDENLELNFNVADVTNRGSYQLRVSYSFLDGRLRITREGSFTNAQNETDLSSAIGDWTLEYLLSNSGKYRLKTYRRNNTGVAGAAGTSNLNASGTATVGFSFMYTDGFNRLADLFAKGRANNPNASGLRVGDDTGEVVMNIPEATMPTNLRKKDAEAQIIEEDLFPLKRRMDTLRVIHKNLPTKNTTTPDNQNSKNTQSDPDYGSDPVPEKYKTNDTQKKTEKSKPQKPLSALFIFHYVGKPVNDFPLPHRFGIK